MRCGVGPEFDPAGLAAEQTASAPSHRATPARVRRVGALKGTMPGSLLKDHKHHKDHEDHKDHKDHEDHKDHKDHEDHEDHGIWDYSSQVLSVEFSAFGTWQNASPLTGDVAESMRGAHQLGGSAPWTSLPSGHSLHGG